VVRIGKCPATGTILGYVAYSEKPIAGYRRLAYKSAQGICGVTTTGHPITFADECSDCELTNYYVPPQLKVE
jgi:hypothetical protein